MSFLIKDDRIASIAQDFITSAGAEVIDLADAAAMPGFIDARRPFGPIGNFPPKKAEARCYAGINILAIAA